MTNATAIAATSPSTAVTAPKTRKVEVAIFTAEGLAALVGLPLLAVKSATPPHATRICSEYLVIAEHASRLRAISDGTPAERVYRRENEQDAREAFESERPIRETVARADAQYAAEKAAEKAKQVAFAKAYREREARKLGADTADRRTTS